MYNSLLKSGRWKVELVDIFLKLAWRHLSFLSTAQFPATTHAINNRIFIQLIISFFSWKSLTLEWLHEQNMHFYFITYSVTLRNIFAWDVGEQSWTECFSFSILFRYWTVLHFPRCRHHHLVLVGNWLFVKHKANIIITPSLHFFGSFRRRNGAVKRAIY